MSNNKILFVIYSIYGGGSQKQMQYILRYIDKKRFEPHLCVFHLNGKEEEVVPKDVPAYDLSTKLRPASFFLVIKLIKLIKKIKPNKMLSFMWGANLISLFAGILTQTPVIVSERIYTPLDITEYPFCKIRRKLISLLYRKSTKVIVASQDVKMGLIKYSSILKNKIRVINNGIDISGTVKAAEDYELSVNNYILACGRLERQKNFGLLLAAMSGIPDFSLVILGDGTQRSYLENKAIDLGIDLFLLGYIDNPYPYFKNARVFVLTSLYEGFPNVVLEAIACRVPVVSVDCPGGVNEIIENGKTGLLVPSGDKKVLASAVIRLLENKHLCKILTKNAYRKVKEEFTLDRMVKSYEDVLK